MKKKWTTGQVSRLLLAVLVIVSTYSFKAPSSSSQQAFSVVVQIGNLDSELYGELVKSSRQDENLEISLACVPINMLIFKSKDTGISLENFKEYLTLWLQDHGNLENIVLTNYSKDEFDEQCANSRIGG